MLLHNENFETQTAIGDSVDGLLSQHYRFETRASAIAAGKTAVPGFWLQLAEMGLLGIELPAAFGGIDASFEELALVLQAFGSFLVLEPYVATAVIGTGLIKALGDAAQQGALLADIVSGQIKLAVALNPEHATAVAAAGGWRVTGHCDGLIGGDAAEILLVAASGPTGISVFAIPASHAGVTLLNYRLYDGRGAADLVIDAQLDDAARLGAPGAAAPALELARDRGATAMVHEAVGAMQKLHRLTVDYLKARVQFGQPLANFQVLRHKMVDMWLAVEQARSMALLATAAVAEPDPVKRGVDISAAKILIGDSAKFVGETAVQIHGAIALTSDYPGGHYFKRLTMIRAEFGDEIHHLERIARLSR